MQNGITKKVGNKPGKTIAIFAGIHGNEKVGTEALSSLIQNTSVKSGCVYFVYANPPAIDKNVRAVSKNMNRLFTRSSMGETYEDIRAHELMDILDTCDALLDIHSYNSESGDQFSISEPEGFDLLKLMDFPIVAEGFSGLGFGTDSYMHTAGKVGICIECGTTNKFKEFLPLAVKSAKQFMQYFGCIESTEPYDAVKQIHIKASRIIYKKYADFKFIKDFKDFEALSPGEVFAVQGDEKEVAQEKECIIFPRPNESIGSEAGIVAKII